MRENKSRLLTGAADIAIWIILLSAEPTTALEHFESMSMHITKTNDKCKHTYSTKNPLLCLSFNFLNFSKN